MKIDVVCHCWRYPRLLRLFLTALWRWPPPRVVGVRLLLYLDADAGADECWKAAGAAARPLCERGIAMFVAAGESTWARTRSLGRHAACLSSDADWLWLAGVDWLVGPGTFRQLHRSLLRAQQDVLRPRAFQESGAWRPVAAAAQADFPIIEAWPEFRGLERRKFCRTHGCLFYRGTAARARGYCGGLASPEPRPGEFRHPLAEDQVFAASAGPLGVADCWPMIHVRHPPGEG